MSKRTQTTHNEDKRLLGDADSLCSKCGKVLQAARGDILNLLQCARIRVPTLPFFVTFQGVLIYGV